MEKNVLIYQYSTGYVDMNKTNEDRCCPVVWSYSGGNERSALLRGACWMFRCSDVCILEMLMSVFISYMTITALISCRLSPTKQLFSVTRETWSKYRTVHDGGILWPSTLIKAECTSSLNNFPKEQLLMSPEPEHVEFLSGHSCPAVLVHSCFILKCDEFHTYCIFLFSFHI